MTAILKRIDDPRGPLDRLRRYELLNLARQNNVPDVNDNTPAILMRKRIKAAGVKNIPIVHRRLGVTEGAPMASGEPDGVEVDAEADLERQFAATPPAPVKTPAQMAINELRAEAKRLGIKLTRRDNMITMKAKIEEHGKNAS